MNKPDIVLKTLVGICIALATFSLKWTFNANAQITKMEEARTSMKEARKAEMKVFTDALIKIEIDRKIEVEAANKLLALQFKIFETKFTDLEDTLITVTEDTDDITRLEKTARKHWKLHSWAKDNINELRNEHDTLTGIASWPDLD